MHLNVSTRNRNGELIDVSRPEVLTGHDAWPEEKDLCRTVGRRLASFPKIHDAKDSSETYCVDVGMPGNDPTHDRDVTHHLHAVDVELEHFPDRPIVYLRCPTGGAVRVQAGGKRKRP